VNTLRSVISAEILLTITSLASTGAEAQVYAGPKCLGPVCIDRNASFEGLAQHLGGPSSAGGIYGYRAKNAQAFLIIIAGAHGELGSVSLRDFAEFGSWTEKDEKVTAQDIRNWKTPEQIGLGSPEADVVKAYGRPSGVEDLGLEDIHHQRGKRLLIYKGRLNGAVLAVRFRLRDGRVSFVEFENDAFVGPDCLGPYCTNGELTPDSLLQGLGLPPQKSRVLPLLCFQSQDAQAFLHFSTDVEETSGVADFLMSDFPNCLHTSKRLTPNLIRAWKTPEGIGLGSPEEDVLKAYGTPSAEKKLDAEKPIRETKGLIAGYRAGDKQIRIGDKVVIYGPRELQAADFGIRDGKVSYIWLKDSDFWLKDGQQ
jgi:hypothetical protein